MKYATSVYKPSLLIRDINQPVPKYYRSADVSWSPFTKLGSFDEPVAAKPSVIRPRSDVRQPLFHDVTAISALNPAQPKVLQAAPFSDITPRVAPRHITKPHAHMLPKKYALESGVTTDLNRPTFKLSALGVILAFGLFLSMLAFGPAKQPSNGGPSGLMPTRTAAPSALTVPVATPATTASPQTAANSTVNASSPSWITASTADTGSSSSDANSTVPVGGYGGGGDTTSTGDTGSSTGAGTGGGSGSTGSDGGTTTDPGTGSTGGSDDGSGSSSGSSDPIITIPPVTVDPTGSTPIIQTGSINVL